MAPQFSPLRGRLTFRLLDEIDSTNLEMRRLIEGGDSPDRLVLQARRQTAGRGRLGRPWLSEDGNMFVTFAFRAGNDLRHLAESSFVVSLAVLDLVRKLCPDAPVKLKWPNDVLVNDRKLSGILLETSQDPAGDGWWLMIGVGLNIVTAPSVGDYETACLTDLADGRALPHLEETGRFFADCLALRLDVWRDQGFARMRRDWMAAAARLGDTITVFAGNDSHTGVFLGISDDGALQLSTAPGQILDIHAGDVLWPGLAPAENNGGVTE